MAELPAATSPVETKASFTEGQSEKLDSAFKGTALVGACVMGAVFVTLAYRLYWKYLWDVRRSF